MVAHRYIDCNEKNTRKRVKKNEITAVSGRIGACDIWFRRHFSPVSKCRRIERPMHDRSCKKMV